MSTSQLENKGFHGNESLGLHRHRHWLCYAPGPRGHFWWIPFPILRVVVKIWNWVSCRLFHHEVCGPYEGEPVPFCAHCSKKFPNNQKPELKKNRETFLN